MNTESLKSIADNVSLLTSAIQISNQPHWWDTQWFSALIGASAAIIFGGLGSLAGKYIQRIQDRTEALRRTEIFLALVINDLYHEREEFKKFVNRLRKLVSDISKIEGEKIYSVEETNFPHTTDIFLDDEIPKLKFKSYYLHNKLLFIYANTKTVNSSFKELKENFATIVKKNEMIVTLRENPINQRKMYSENLSNFAKGIDDFMGFLDKGILTVAQAKVYNAKIRKSRILAFWKYEKGTFRYFRTRKDHKQYSWNLDSLDRIDKTIDPEVKDIIAKSESRKPPETKSN